MISHVGIFTKMAFLTLNNKFYLCNMHILCFFEFTTKVITYVADNKMTYKERGDSKALYGHVS